MKKKKQADPLSELASSWRVEAEAYERVYHAIIDLYPQLRDRRAAMTKAERAFRERYWQRHGNDWANSCPPETDDAALAEQPEVNKE